MKRFVYIMVLVLLLAGCSNEKSNGADKNQTEPTAGWYDADHSVEALTNGAIRAYQLQTADVSQIAMIGDNVVLIENGEKTKLTVMERSEGVIIAQGELEEGSSELQIINNALAYYVSETKEMVCLDRQLCETSRIKMPDDTEGVPVYALDSSEIFYVVAQEIRAFDTTLNISRPVRSHNCKTQEITGAYFGGSVISCVLTNEDDTETILYLSAKTGEALTKDEILQSLTTDAEQYMCLRYDGIVRQQVFGTKSGGAYNMNISQSVQVAPALAAGGMVTWDTVENAKQLAFYDFQSGMKTAELSVSNIGDLTAVVADRNGFWFTAETEDAQMLFYWTFELSAVTDETVYKTTLYTAENPDKEGLKNCEKRADSLAGIHYVDIRIWNEAVSSTGDHVLVAEYQTSAIDQALDELELVLARYPDRFLYKSANNILRISIVRSVDGNSSGVYFRRGNDPFIVLPVGCDIQEEFDKAMGYLINSRVLGKSPMLDNWNDLNPESFVYGETVAEAYLTGADRAFADEQSMSSVTDDRSILFYHAMKEGNSAVFQSPVMQAKLKKLCLGIRDAWRWEDRKETFLWEQYLTEPIAPQS